MRPSRLEPLGVGHSQQDALSSIFGAVPPQHVREAEALIDRGMESMDVSSEGSGEVMKYEFSLPAVFLSFRCLQQAVLDTWGRTSCPTVKIVCACFRDHSCICMNAA